MHQRIAARHLLSSHGLPAATARLAPDFYPRIQGQTMKLTKTLAIATALAFITPPSFAATNDLPQDAAEQRSCSASRALTRHELEESSKLLTHGLEVIQTREQATTGSTPSDFSVTQGYRSASGSGKLQLDTFVGYTHSGTYAIQRLYNPSNPEATINETISQVSTNLKLESSFEVISTTSNDTTPQDAPRGRCKTLDWGCAKNRCGWAVNICGKRIQCLAVLCIYAVGSCCTEWEPNPYQ